jgi:hypothetical protein
VGVPTISAIANQITPMDVPRGPIAFTVGDTETPAGLLSVTATSSVPALVPDMNLIVGGSGADRELTVVPAAGMTGVATITVLVSDGLNSVLERFVITVHPVLGLLRMDDFERPDGPLVQLDGQWLSNGGSGGTNLQELQITAGRAKVREDGSEDVSTEMPAGQFTTPIYTPASGTVLYAKLKFRLIDLPSPGGTYFAHFRDGTTGFRARVFVSTTGAAAGKFRLGIANNSASITAPAQVPADLSTNVDYCVVIRYNVATGESRLWLDPDSEASPGVDAVDPVFISDIHAFSFRQNGGIGIVCVDDLKIGTLFTDVSPTRYRLTIERIGPNSVRVSWPEAASGEGLELQSATVLPVGEAPAWGTHSDQGTPAAGNLVVDILNVTGNEFFRLGPVPAASRR